MSQDLVSSLRVRVRTPSSASIFNRNVGRRCIYPFCSSRRATLSRRRFAPPALPRSSFTFRRGNGSTAGTRIRRCPHTLLDLHLHPLLLSRPPPHKRLLLALRTLLLLDLSQALPLFRQLPLVALLLLLNGRKREPCCG
jgi:hypothetical protein